MFHFKQFTIHQDRCAMKVGTDGVLLGAWTDVENAARILDIGTGTGLLALMLAQRAPNALIDAIEIEENAYIQATENVAESPWKDRINIIHRALQDFEPAEKYDLIVSNPPYFLHSLKNPDTAKKTARHTDTLMPTELITYAKRLLHENGRLSVIYPTTEALLFIKEAEKKMLHCSRITKVFPNIGAKEKRLLMEFSVMPTECRNDEIYIENNVRHNYTEAYKVLTKDFYLNF